MLSRLHLPQAGRTPRLSSRPRSLYSLAVTASSTSKAPSPVECSAPAAYSQRGVWTVVVATVEDRWCASVQEGAGWFTVSRPGVMRAEHSGPLVSTPECRPSARGYRRWSEVLGGSSGREISNDRLWERVAKQLTKH